MTYDEILALVGDLTTWIDAADTEKRCFCLAMQSPSATSIKLAWERKDATREAWRFFHIGWVGYENFGGTR